MKINKINLFLFIIGLISIVAFFGVGYLITESRDIRLNGKLSYAPITGYYGRISRPKGGVYVNINGKTYYSNGFDKSYSIGDSIAVRYVEHDNRAIQERINPNRYYLYYVLDALLLAIGYLLIKESFKGKSIWRY
jgi:hypothetical protein